MINLPSVRPQYDRLGRYAILPRFLLHSDSDISYIVHIWSGAIIWKPVPTCWLRQYK